MNIKIELRYAMLNSILMLLWLSVEFLIGLQDNFIAWHPYVSILSVVIPIFCYRMAIKEKTESLRGGISVRKAFISGLIITLISCVLVLPVQFIFHKLVNPAFFDTMIQYASQTGNQKPEEAAKYFNFPFYVAESVLITFFEGIIISIILAMGMRTRKRFIIKKRAVVLVLILFIGYENISAQGNKNTGENLKAYFFVLLKAGPHRNQDSITIAKIQKGHLENINQMASSGKLNIAGPLLDDGDLKGIYIFDSDSEDEVKAMMNSDPAIIAGRLIYEIHPWMTEKGTCLK